MRHAHVIGVTDFDDGNGVVGVFKVVACSANDGPGFADDATSGRDEERGEHDVHAVGEVPASC
jgi:hypothetical protein